MLIFQGVAGLPILLFPRLTAKQHSFSPSSIGVCHRRCHSAIDTQQACSLACSNLSCNTASGGLPGYPASPISHINGIMLVKGWGWMIFHPLFRRQYIPGISKRKKHCQARVMMYDQITLYKKLKNPLTIISTYSAN